MLAPGISSRGPEATQRRAMVFGDFAEINGMFVVIRGELESLLSTGSLGMANVQAQALSKSAHYLTKQVGQVGQLRRPSKLQVIVAPCLIRFFST